MHPIKNKRICRSCGEVIPFGNSPCCENCDISLSNAKQRRQYRYMVRNAIDNVMEREP